MHSNYLMFVKHLEHGKGVTCMLKVLPIIYYQPFRGGTSGSCGYCPCLSDFSSSFTFDYYSLSSLSRLRLSRITAYLEEKI